MRVDPRHFRVLRAIVEHGTFNKAAAALGATQPALSKSIALLEQSLGTKLFERGRWGNSLTEAGLIAARSAESIDWAIIRLQEEIAAQKQNLEGPLKLGVAPSLAQGLLPSVLASGDLGSSSATATIFIDTDRALLDALDRGEIELAISPVQTTAVLEKHVKETVLAREPFLLGVKKGHRLLNQRTVTIADIVDEHWILPPAKSGYQQTIEAMFLAAGYPLPANVITTSNPNLQEALAVSTGRLCIINPSQFIGREPPFEIMSFTNPAYRSIGIRTLAGLSLTPLAATLIDRLKAVVSQWLENAQPIWGVDNVDL